MPAPRQGNDGPGAPVPRPELDDGGYILVALLVGMAVAAVWMSALLPSWRQQAIREKEAELVFRGEQYARAIELYRRRNGNSLPPNLDVLVTQRFLRKKYTDPITGRDFVPVGGVSSVPGQTSQVGITGVRSTSTDASILIYRNQQTYSQFAFDFLIEQQKTGMGSGMGELPPVGGRGVPGVGPEGFGRGLPGVDPGRSGGRGRGLGPPDGNLPGDGGLPAGRENGPAPGSLPAQNPGGRAGELPPIPPPGRFR